MCESEQQVRSANRRVTTTLTAVHYHRFSPQSLPPTIPPAHGSGRLSILAAPKSLDFVSTDAALSTSSLAELYAAALGLPVAGSDPWSGLHINDPFNAAQLAVTFVIPTQKTNLQLATAAATYNLNGPNVQAALASLDERVQTQQIDLAAVSDTKTDAKQADAKYVALKPETNAAERKFLAVTAALARFADSVELSPSAEPLFVSAIVSADGLAASSELAQTEARKLLQQAVQSASASLQKKFGGAVLVTVVESAADELKRQKRQAAPSADVSSAGFDISVEKKSIYK